MKKILSILMFLVIGCSSSASRTGVADGSYEGKCYDNGTCDNGFVCDGGTNVCLTPNEVGSDTGTSISSTGSDSTVTNSSSSSSTVSSAYTAGEQLFIDWMKLNPGVNLGMTINMVYSAGGSSSYTNIVYPLSGYDGIWVAKNHTAFQYDGSWSYHSGYNNESDWWSLLDLETIKYFVNFTLSSGSCVNSGILTFGYLPGKFSLTGAAQIDMGLSSIETVWDFSKLPSGWPSNLCITLNPVS